jgi:hypothetical protein
MIEDFGELLDNMQDATHRMAIYSNMPEIFNHRRCNNKYVSEEKLDAIELGIYHCIMVEVKGLEGEHISQMCQYTGSQSWPGGD